ncbi:MAG: DUF3552 domain-containing protein, partial [Candidatus Peribacteraceae bacterium]|nr:DUF3552 domain-containing protein [Candidatus Peribacteraceae bacterium]
MEFISTKYIIVFLALLAGTQLGLLAGWFWFSKGKKISNALQSEINQKEKQLQRLEGKLNETRSNIRTTEAEARSTANEILSEAKIKASEMETKLEKEQGRLEEKEKSLDEKVEEAERQRVFLKDQENEVNELKEELSTASAEHRKALEKAAKMPEAKAKEELKEELEKEFSEYYASQAKLVKERIKEEYEEDAKNLLSEAMQRYASEVATESTSTIVQIPSDDVKGKIIGKEGRNIITFEKMTGVDIIIDDTPGAIV